MFAILPVVLFAIIYVTCAILEDTDFGRDMDAGEYRFAIQQYIAKKTGFDLNARDLEAARQSRGLRVDVNRGVATGNDTA
jgi:hypothetical protein